MNNPDKIALCILELVMIFLMVLPVLYYPLFIFPMGICLFIYIMIIQSIKDGEETLVYKFVKGENNGRRK